MSRRPSKLLRPTLGIYEKPLFKWKTAREMQAANALYYMYIHKRSLPLPPPPQKLDFSVRNVAEYFAILQASATYQQWQQAKQGLSTTTHVPGLPPISQLPPIWPGYLFVNL